jgi:hypothetical protein
VDIKGRYNGKASAIATPYIEVPATFARARLA